MIQYMYNYEFNFWLIQFLSAKTEKWGFNLQLTRPHMIQSLRSDMSSEEKKKNLILIHSASTFLLHESKREVVVPIHQKKAFCQSMYHVDISFLCHFRLAWLGCYFVWKTQMVLYLARRGSRKVHQQAAASCRGGKSFSKKKTILLS